MRPLLAGVVALAVVLGATACRDDGSAPDPAVRTSPSATPPPPGPVLDGSTSALPDLQIRACPPGTGALVARGSIVNHAARAFDYAVTVTWLAPDGKQLQVGFATVADVPPGARRSWRVAADLSATAGSCTTRLAKGTLLGTGEPSSSPH